MAQPEIQPNLEPLPVPAAPRAEAAAKAPRQKIREMELIITDVIWETADTVTLNLFTGGERPDYQAGQFITIRPQQFPALASLCSLFRESSLSSAGCRTSVSLSSSSLLSLAVPL